LPLSSDSHSVAKILVAEFNLVSPSCLPACWICCPCWLLPIAIAIVAFVPTCLCFTPVADLQLRPNQRYTVTATAATLDGRSGSSSLSFIPVIEQLPNGQVYRTCGANVTTGAPLPCPGLHNPTDSLTLIVLPDPEYSSADIQWMYDPIAVPGLVLNEASTMTGTDQQSLIILPEGLPSGGSVTVDVNLTMPTEVS